MTAYQILMHELAAHGRVTYAELCARHPEYDHVNYSNAVYKARKLGIVRTEGRKNVVIIATGACPCCGRAIWRPEAAEQVLEKAMEEGKR
jgi:hypothetical protein